PPILGDVQLSPNAARARIESHDYPRDSKLAIDFSRMKSTELAHYSSRFTGPLLTSRPATRAARRSFAWRYFSLRGLTCSPVFTWSATSMPALRNWRTLSGFLVRS